MRRFMTTLGVMLLTAMMAACTTNPATGKKQLNVLSTQEEIQLGREAAPEFLQEYGGPIPSEPIRAYVSDLGRRLASQSERANLPWEFNVVDSAVINAFALPGGKVFISRALLEKMENEAQLAGVLGHEIGHVTAQHIGQQMSQAMILQGVGVAVGVAADQSDNDWLRVLGVGTQVGGTVYLLKYGRDQELEADRLGVRYMARLGYNPMAQVQVMEILRKAGGGSGKTMEWLSTHPAPQTRVDRLRKLIVTNYPDHDDETVYQYHAQRYADVVKQNLTQLPPPKHNP